MIINAQIKDLVRDEEDELYLEHMTENSVGRMSSYSFGEVPKKRKLICHLINKDYKPPAAIHLWRNEDSTSRKENIVIKELEADEEEEVQSVRKEETEAVDETDAYLNLSDFDDEVGEDGIPLTEEERAERKRKREESGKQVVIEKPKKKKKPYRVQSLDEMISGKSKKPVIIHDVEEEEQPTQPTQPGGSSTRKTQSSQIPTIPQDQNIANMMTVIINL